MITLLRVCFMTLIHFIYITIFKVRKIKKMPDEEATSEARKEMKILAKKVLDQVQINLEIEYLNKEAFDKLKLEDGIVIVSNHQSNLDIPVLVTAINIPIGFVAKKEMESWPIYSTWMKLSKCIFLDRKNPREGMKSIKKAVEVVKNGYPTVIFPEGERSLTGQVGEFKKGSFKLATETNGIILPVTINGTYNIQKKGSLFMKSKQKVKVIIGEPINLKILDAETLKNLSSIVKEKIENEKLSF